MKMRFAFLAVTAFTIAACSGNVSDDEVVLSEGTNVCPITRGVDVCAYFEQSKPAIREDITIALQRSSTLAMRSRDVVRRAKLACEAIARDLGNNSAVIIEPSPESLKASCERARDMLRAEIATSTLRVKLITGGCPKRSGTSTTCSEARDAKAPACTPSTIEITGGNENTLRAQKTMEANLLTLADASEEGLQIADEITRVSPTILSNTTGTSTRDTACKIPLVRLVQEGADDIQAVGTSSIMVLAVAQ
jgi:hypothetical protein